ncbi:MAG: antitoxin VbhA family protein [Bacilli bacterium]
MNKKSINEILSCEKEKRFKKDCWDFALGLQKIDNFEPDEEYIELMKKEINGEITLDDMEEIVLSKYKNKVD